MTKEKILKIALLICLIASIYLVYNTYSRYTEEVEAKYNINVSQWLIKIQDKDIYDDDSWAEDITPHYVADENIADVNVIVPGGKAYLEFKMDYSAVNVAFEMQGTIENTSATTVTNATNTSAENTNVFKDIKILGYTIVDSSGNESAMVEAEDDKIVKKYNLTELPSSEPVVTVAEVTGSEEGTGTESTPTTETKIDTIRIYFTWYDDEDEEMDDEADTAFKSENTYTNYIKYKLTLNFNQINPSPDSENSSGENNENSNNENSNNENSNVESGEGTNNSGESQSGESTPVEEGG
jgi:hypothetical protein